MLPELTARLQAERDRLTAELVGLVRGGAGEMESEAERGRQELRSLARRQLRLLEQLAAGLATVDPEAIRPDRAGYGSLVQLRDFMTGDDRTYTLMNGDFMDLEEGQVSLASPIGHALLGTRVGDRIAVETPRGRREYLVLGLVTLPQRMGMGTGEGASPDPAAAGPVLAGPAGLAAEGRS